jgi:hypothetical protein
MPQTSHGPPTCRPRFGSTRPARAHWTATALRALQKNTAFSSTCRASEPLASPRCARPRAPCRPALPRHPYRRRRRVAWPPSPTSLHHFRVDAATATEEFSIRPGLVRLELASFWLGRSLGSSFSGRLLCARESPFSGGLWAGVLGGCTGNGGEVRGAEGARRR